MSRFLQTLVSRAHGDAPRIQPRLRSRFETPTQDHAQPITSDEDQRLPLPAAERSSVTPPSPLAIPGKARPAHPDPHPATTTETRSAAASADSAATPARRVVTPPVAPIAQHPREEPEPLLIPAGAASMRSVSDAPLREPKQTAESRESPDALPKPKNVVPREIASPGPERAALVTPKREDKISAPGSPPSIQITIGRIDVRAEAPAARPAPTRAKTPAPVLSLDDYLRRREGGRA